MEAWVPSLSLSLSLKGGIKPGDIFEELRFKGLMDKTEFDLVSSQWNKVGRGDKGEERFCAPSLSCLSYHMHAHAYKSHFKYRSYSQRS